MRGVKAFDLRSRSAETSRTVHKESLADADFLLRERLEPILARFRTHPTVAERSEGVAGDAGRNESRPADARKLVLRHQTGRARHLQPHEAAVLCTPDRIFGDNLVPNGEFVALRNLREASVPADFFICQGYGETVAGRTYLSERLAAALAQHRYPCVEHTVGAAKHGSDCVHV